MNILNNEQPNATTTADNYNYYVTLKAAFSINIPLIFYFSIDISQTLGRKK